MADLVRLRAGDASEQIAGALQRDGAVIVEGLLDADTLERFGGEVGPLVEAERPDREFLNPAVAYFFGKRTRHLTSVAAKSRVFAHEVLCHPLLLSLCDQILLPGCASYQLNIAQVLDRGPGADDQLLHRDEAVWVHLPRPHPEVQLASVIALVDFTRENGATRVAPGSHRWPPERRPEPHQLVSAAMPAGSAVLYLGSTLHGGGANTTRDVWRRGMHLSYVVGWLRTEENHYLATPLEVVRGLPRRAQELLGYSAHDAIAQAGGYLGTVDLRSPIDLLQEGRL
jgi:ectoine hydroxylase-related dioxygenase (phytanoyl-CoA dioxygenase family)